MADILRMDSIGKRLNDLTYTDFYFRLNLIARSVFHWENLPNHIDERWIEKYLFYYGTCVFFKNEELGLMVAKATENGPLNAYDDPTVIRPYATNKTFPEYEVGKDCVIIRNNDIMLPTEPTIQLFAWRLADISRTIDTNIAAQKTPIIVLCSDKQKLSLKTVLRQATGNELVIYGSKDLDMENITALKTEAPVVFPELQTQKHSIWNECMTFLGVNNANMDKRERLIVDEVESNNEQIQISADVMLKTRQEACKQINDLFGTNITVSLRNAVNELPTEKEVGSV